MTANDVLSDAIAARKLTEEPLLAPPADAPPADAAPAPEPAPKEVEHN